MIEKSRKNSYLRNPQDLDPMLMCILDVDGTLGDSPFKNIKHNDNSQLENPGFIQKLKSVVPFPWVTQHDWNQYASIYVITGRLAAWNQITHEWLYNRAGIKVYHSDITNTEWNDTYESRTESYHDYVRRKTWQIASQICQCHLYRRPARVEVYEDDKNVIKALVERCNGWASFFCVIDGVPERITLGPSCRGLTG